MNNISAVIDIDLGKKLARDKLDLAQELLGVLVKTLPDEIAEIQLAKKNNDYEELQKLVHRLHGAICYCGVPRLKQVIYTIETALKEKNLDDLSELLLQLDIEANLVVKHAADIL